MGQNIVELGFNVEEFSAEQKVVYQGMLMTLELAQKIDGFKMNIASTGWAELKDKVNGATQAQSEYEAISRRVSDRIAQMNGQSKEFTTVLNKEADTTLKLTKSKVEESKERLNNAKAAEIEAKTTKELANAKLLEEKTKTQSNATALAEIKLREANERVAAKEAAALEKSTAAKQLELSSLDNESKRQAIIAAKEAEERASIELAQSLEFQAKAQEELNAAQASAAASGNQPAKLKTESSAVPDTAAVVQYRDELERLTGTIEENQKLHSIYVSELEDVNNKLKVLKSTTDNSAKGSKNYQDELAGLNARQKQLKTDIKDVNKVIELQVKENNSAAGSIDQLRARYALLLRQVELGGTAFKASGPGKLILAETQQVKTALDTAERQALLFRGSLSNVGSAVTGFASKAFGALRTIANILPGLGIGTLLGYIVDGVVEAVKSMSSAVGEAKKLEERSKLISEVYKEAAKSVGETVAKLKVVKETLNDLSVPEKERLKTLKQYNETADETNKIDATQINNLQLINEKIDAQNKLILKRAVSLAATSKLGEQASTFVDAELQLGLFSQKNKLSKSADELASDYDKFITKSFPVRNIKEKREKLKKEFLSSIGLSDKDFEELSGLISKRRDAVFGLSKANNALSGLIITDGTDKAGGSSSKKQTEDYSKDLAKILADISKAEYDALKQTRQDQIKLFEDITNDTTKGYNERYAASQLFYDKSKELIDLNNAYELAASKKAIEEEKRQVQLKLDKKDDKGKSNLTVKQRTVLNNTLIALDKKLASDEELINAKHDSEMLKLDNNSEKQRTYLLKSEWDKRKKLREEAQKANEDHDRAVNDLELATIQNGYDEALNLLEKSFSKGEIKEKEYNQRKVRLQVNLQKSLLEAQIAYTAKLIEDQKIRFKADEADLQHKIENAKVEAALEKDPDKKADQLKAIEEAEHHLAQMQVSDNDVIASSEQKLGALKIKLASLITEFFKKKNKETKDDWIKTLEDIAGVAKGLIDVIGGFVNASAVKQKNAIQELIDANNEFQKAETERINNSTLSEQDKAAKLIQLNAEVDAKNKQYALEQRKRDIEKAKFDKAAAIANIILNTAVAVSKFLAKGDIPEAIAAGVMGAAQLAVAISTPIATYAEGTDDHPGGDAIVGEGKGPELVQEPNKKPYVVDKATLIKDLPKHSKVIPLTVADINESMFRAGSEGMAKLIALTEAVEKKNSNDAWKIAQWQAEQTRKAFADNNKKQPVRITNKIDFGWAAYVEKNIFRRTG